MPGMNDADTRSAQADALIGALQRQRSGRLTLFLGDAPGVGKTYTMLSRARELQQRGIVLAFGRVSPALLADMQRHGIAAALGAHHLHATLHAALADARGARP